MNCKPGDLAVVVRARFDPSHLGKIVSVVEWDDEAGGWKVDPPIMTAGIPWRAVADHALRPIRDPGDDAVDEMIQRIGVSHGVPA